MQPPRRNLAGRFILVVAGCLALAGLAPAGKGGPNDLASYDALIKPSDRKHWAFQPVRRPALPIVKNAAWMRNPIDAFILAKLEARNWRPAPAAQPRALLRRLFFDLSGLPPTLAEQEAFLKDPSPQALDQIATELLARPTYGERWARHWLDLVRYAETNGYERDATKPNVWRYRDYVITALNGDKPFDRFILEQLAGDELPDVSSESLIASGYCRLGPWDDEPADPKEDRFDQLDDMVSTTSLAFLGLSLGWRALPQSQIRCPDPARLLPDGGDFRPAAAPRNGRTELDRPAASRDQIIAKARREAAVGLAGFEAPPSTLSPEAQPISSIVSLRLLAEARDPSATLPRGYFLVEPSARPPATHLLIRGKASRPGPEVEPGMPAVLVSSQPSFPAPGERNTFRRLTLANWIASPANPLTAGVIVNRVWQFHFGEGLVRTPSDFGVMGEPPTHPELLDWLADWFVKEGWSLKKLHRLIVTSNAYRMSKAWNTEYGAQDPENLLLCACTTAGWKWKRCAIPFSPSTVSSTARCSDRACIRKFPGRRSRDIAIPTRFGSRSANARLRDGRSMHSSNSSMVVPMLEVFDLCDTCVLVGQAERDHRGPAGLESVQRGIREPSGARSGAAAVARSRPGSGKTGGTSLPIGALPASYTERARCPGGILEE